MHSDRSRHSQRFLVELLFSPLFHLVSSIALALIGSVIVVPHPHIATYSLYFLSLGSLLLFAALLRRRRAEKQAGKVYTRGEIEAHDDIRHDLRRVPAGSTVTVCGTGVTAISDLAADLYSALRRGVDFEVFALHPRDELTDHLGVLEPDLDDRVADPLVRRLKRSEDVRRYLGWDWCDHAAAVLEDRQRCDRHHSDGFVADCALHSRVICTGADMWKQLASQLQKTAPDAPRGQLIVRGYHILPLLKAWRFRSPPGQGETWYYFADQVYHPGVGVDNPMRRVVAGTPSEGETLSQIGNPNIDRLDAYLTLVRERSEEL